MLLVTAITTHAERWRHDLERREQARQIVHERIGDLRTALVRRLTGYTIWTEAVAHLDTEIDQDWAERTLGKNLYDRFGIDSLVIDGDDRVLFANDRDGHGAASTDRPPLAQELHALVRRARDTTTAVPPTQVLHHAGGWSIAAADEVQPDPGWRGSDRGGADTVIVFIRTIDQSELDRWRDELGLPDLAIVPAHAPVDDQAALALYDAEGRPVAQIVWTPQDSGWGALTWFGALATGVLLLTLLFAALMLRERRARHMLLESEARFKELASATSDWFWETDRTLRVTWVSERFGELVGLDCPSLRQKAAGPDDPGGAMSGDWDRHVADITARRPFRDFVYALDDEQGRRRILSASAVPRFTPAGAFLGYRGVGRDITEQWEARRTLEAVQQRLSIALENAGQWVWDWDIPANRVWRSPQYKTTLGYRDDEVDTEDEAWRIVHPDDRAGLRLDRLLTGKTDLFKATYRLRHKDGRWRWILSRGKVVARDEAGAPLRLLAASIDVTEEQRREAELREAHALVAAQNEALQVARQAAEAAARAKSDFLAAMSHEIRTPMTSVLGMADLLAAEELAPHQRHFVDTIRGSGRHLLNIINDILDFSRIEAGRLELERTDFILADIVEQVHSLLAPQANERGLGLRLAVAAERLPVVRGDPMRLCQILVNLIGNGLKFTRAGEVSLTVREGVADAATVRLRFEVRDTGIGIPAHRQAELFEAFVQVDSSTNRHFGGSGLGLAICKRLVTAMAGTIGVESSEGHGSLFWFEVPFRRGDPALITDRRDAPAPRLRPLRILVVDDVPANRDLLQEMLRRHGHVVEVAKNGAVAVERVGRQTFDVVLMDVQMPVMDGMEATRRIRALPPPAGAVPIFALTANVVASDRERHLAAGMNLCLTKPVIWPELFAALAGVAGTEMPPMHGPHPADAADPPQLIDRRLLEGLAANLPPEAFKQLVRRGLDGASKSCLLLREACGQPAGLARTAHRLRGTAGTFGFARIATLAGAIEAQAEHEPALAALLGELEQVVAATRAGVEQLLASLP